MRKFLISAAVIALIGSASAATAQDQDHHRGGGDNRPHGENHGAPAQNSPAINGRNAIGQREMREHHDAPATRVAAQPAPGTPEGAAADTMRGINRQMDRNLGRQDNNRQDNNRQDNNRQDNNRQQSRPDSNRQNANRPDLNNDRRDSRRNDNNRPDFDRRNGFGNDNRGNRGRHDFSNFRNFHQNFRAERRFHGPFYRRPPGYYARRWSWGQVLPSFFWTRDYWLTDYYDYDLPPPPFGAIWVRVGDDALLIDQDSGEIIEVEYGIFY
jgi:Ni/Co efflux regulator RcnB